MKPELRMDTNYFSFHEVVQGSAEYEEYLEARYQVFCEELGRVESPGMLSSNGHPIETDQYDGSSRHFIARHRASGTVAGFMRVILPSQAGLNVSTRYVIEHPLPYEGATEDMVGEISRLAVTPMFRRRHDDEGKSVQGDPESESSSKVDGLRRHQPELVLGMYREVYRLCRQIGLDYCVAAMDRRFSRLLTTLGFPFVAVSQVNEAVTPPRRVYLISAEEMERALGTRENCILKFMQEQLGTVLTPAMA